MDIILDKDKPETKLCMAWTRIRYPRPTLDLPLMLRMACELVRAERIGDGVRLVECDSTSSLEIT
jgi:hypothetical protein